MSIPDDDAALAAVGVHVDTASSKMSSVRISQKTADQVREVRKSINAAAGTQILTNEDIVRLSLLTLGRLGEVADGEDGGLSEQEEDVMMPLMDHITDAVDPDVLQRHMDATDADGGDTQ
jgi:hypothetical protein